MLIKHSAFPSLVLYYHLAMAPFFMYGGRGNVTCGMKVQTQLCMKYEVWSMCMYICTSTAGNNQNVHSACICQ